MYVVPVPPTAGVLYTLPLADAGEPVTASPTRAPDATKVTLPIRRIRTEARQSK